MCEMLTDESIRIHDFQVIDENILLLQYKLREEKAFGSTQANIFIAATTTCHARLILYRLLIWEIVACTLIPIVLSLFLDQESMSPNLEASWENLRMNLLVEVLAVRRKGAQKNITLQSLSVLAQKITHLKQILELQYVKLGGLP